MNLPETQEPNKMMRQSLGLAVFGGGTRNFLDATSPLTELTHHTRSTRPSPVDGAMKADQVKVGLFVSPLLHSPDFAVFFVHHPEAVGKEDQILHT